MKMEKIKCFSVFALYLQSRTKQGFVYSSGTAKDKRKYKDAAGARAGIKPLCTQSGHSSPFQTSLKGVTASVQVRQDGNPFSRWGRDGNIVQILGDQWLSLPVCTPSTLIPVPFQQRCLCYSRDAGDQTSQVSRDRSRCLMSQGDGSFPSNGCID